jgi:hypothetical protein
MPRARNLKPGFFSNEDLAECSPWARLCFAGLWTLADREGRLEDRPKRIKGELFRFDSIEVEPLLVELERFGFVVRYQIDGDRFIQVSKFAEHQTPHYSEKQSVIKPPPLQESASIKKQDAQDKTESPPSDEQSSRGGRNPLNPESRILTPDEDSKLTLAPAFPAEKPPLALVGEPEPQAKGPPDCPHQAVLALWAEVLPALPQHNPNLWRGARESHLRARWRETAIEKGWRTEAEGLAYLRKLFTYVGQSRFLTGRAPAAQGRPPFVAELSWLVNPENWAKTIEGKYHSEAA